MGGVGVVAGINMLQYYISQINPFSPPPSRWLVKEEREEREKEKKKICQPVIICAINGTGYVPVE